MFLAGIEFFFGLAVGFGILTLGILALWGAWKKLTVFPGVLVLYTVAALIAIGLLLRYS